MINVGRVSTRKGARLHIAIDATGRAACGAGTCLTSCSISATDEPLLCRRCRKVRALRNLLITELSWISRRVDAGSRAIARLFEIMIDALRTRAEIAADNALISGITANLLATVQ
jgi:hypothetical protein